MSVTFPNWITCHRPRRHAIISSGFEPPWPICPASVLFLRFYYFTRVLSQLHRKLHSCRWWYLFIRQISITDHYIKLHLRCLALLQFVLQRLPTFYTMYKPVRLSLIHTNFNTNTDIFGKHAVIDRLAVEHDDDNFVFESSSRLVDFDKYYYVAIDLLVIQSHNTFSSNVIPLQIIWLN